MFSWISDALFFVASVGTSWFIAQDEPNFGLMQMAIWLLILSSFVLLLAFWRELSSIVHRLLEVTVKLRQVLSELMAVSVAARVGDVRHEDRLRERAELRSACIPL
jgi:hypothetical protein